MSFELSSGESGEERYQREPGHDETPERIFERRWALSMLERVMERLRDEFVQHGRPENFERMKVFLLGQSDAPYAEPGPRNEHIRRSTESSHPQASQTLSRALSPRNRGHCRRFRRSRVRTAVSGGCADEEVVVRQSTGIRTNHPILRSSRVLSMTRLKTRYLMLPAIPPIASKDARPGCATTAMPAHRCSYSGHGGYCARGHPIPGMRADVPPSQFFGLTLSRNQRHDYPVERLPTK